ncbi:MAG: hypothetical protein IJ264_04185, partial [Clostridia bacterium]|nr:hypothetical protein [Clostridia bacterium]
ANITWGIAFDPDLDDEMVITVIATGFDSKAKEPEKAAPASNPFLAAVANKAPAAAPAQAAPAAPVQAKPAAPAAPASSGPSIPHFGSSVSNDISSTSAPAKEAAPKSDGFEDDQFYIMINDIIKGKDGK